MPKPAEIDFHALIDKGRTALRLPGVAATLADGQRLETHYAGYYEEGGRRPIDSETLFPIGCLAKVVTAVLTLRLCEHGELELNTPLVDCVPRESPLRVQISPTTAIGHVLSHTSALYGPLDYRSFDDSKKSEPGIEEQFEMTVRQSCEPGSVFSYSHTAYVCAALVLETVTQRSWLSMARELFAEIGGRLTDEPGELVPRGHQWCGPDRPARPLDAPVVPRRTDVWTAAIGDAVYTDSASLASLGLALLTEGELSPARPLLSDRSIELLRHAAWGPEYGGSGYSGVGLKQFSRGCYGHRGWGYGQHSFLLICPEQCRVLTFCTNINNDLLARRLMLDLTGADFARGSWMGRESGAPPQQRACVGKFELGDHIIDIASRGSRLTFCARAKNAPSATVPNPVILFPAAPNVFAAPCPFACLPGRWSSVMVEFIQDDEQPDCRWLRVNDLVYERLATGATTGPSSFSP